MAKVITIDYTPRIWSNRIHNTDKRWIVVVAHRRCGKTTMALNHLQRDALKIPDSRWGYISPTYKQSKFIAWDMIKKYARVIPGVVFNESELTVKYPNGSKLTLYGADYPDSLRGMGFWGVIFDEYSQQPSNIFSEIIRPALSDHKGYAIWIGTPKGKNEFYRLYEQGLQDDNWLSVLLTVQNTNIISQEELDEAKKVMTEDEFNQEFNCSFEASIKGAYYSKPLANARIENRITNVPYDSALLVHTVWDLGKGQNMAIGFYQKFGKEIRKIDYWEGSNEDGIPQAIKAIKEKDYVYGKHFAPHDIKAVDLSTGKTRIETAKSLGINFEVVPDIGVNNGINAGKLMFRRLWVDQTKCSMWLDAISQYHQEWDDKRGCFRDNPYHNWTSHGADEYRYASIIEDKMSNEDIQNQQRLINERRNNRIAYE